MRTITNSEVIPAKEIEIITYGCDFCNFTSKRANDVNDHMLAKHTVEKMSAGGCFIYKFLTKEHASAWINAYVKEDYNWTEYDYGFVTWYKPGWYIVRKIHERKYDSSYYVAELYYAETWVENEIEEVKDKMRDVISVRKMLKDAK